MELVAFRPSPIHGLGGFATRDIAAGTRVLEYLGQRIDKQESLRRCEQNNPFIFCLNDHEDIDGAVDWNPARLLNHSCEPNCDALLDDSRIWIIANRSVRAGEELTFNYGFDLEDYRDYPCACGSPNCVGFIVAAEFFDHLSRSTGILPISDPNLT
jgi:SET domain-containing protein